MDEILHSPPSKRNRQESVSDIFDEDVDAEEQAEETQLPEEQLEEEEEEEGEEERENWMKQ